ncbi:MAG: NAD-dependent DNA ligase LigA [Spirochaetaceae bacterium]|nr:NAD-dependent DNA ligase LigA [Spirochaetaceae bacterium]
MSELEQAIQRYQTSYYNGEAESTYAEFDALWDELFSLDPDNPILKKIGADSSEGFTKAAHLIPMGSQDKAADPESFAAWAAKQQFDEFLVEYKLDGASLELQYENGVFTRAVTRGDGVVGDDITRNAMKMQGVVQRFKSGGETVTAPPPPPLTGGVRGEVIMTHAVHHEYFPDKANCRNAANGLMKRKDGAGSEYLMVICYDAFFGGGELPFTDEEEKLRWLSEQGFNTVPLEICKGADAVVDYRAHVMDIRDSLDYDIDGLVIKGREIDPEDMLRARPEKQIAFKFSLEEAITVLRRVEWSESWATYTPIAAIDPVQLAGTTVQRANLNNPNMICSMNLKIGSRVVVTKRGEIIPKIEALVENPPGTVDIEQPTVCETCGTVLTDEGTRLFCPNPACPKRIHHRLEKWVDVLDIRDFGINLIKRLFDSGRLRSVSDIYTLKPEELSVLDRMGEKSAEKVYRSIRSRRTISLAAFVAGFDIEGIGETLMEKLTSAGFDTLEELLAADADDISAVNGFGDITAKILAAGLAENREEMERLVRDGVISIKPPETGGIFRGFSFCFTGELITMKRNDAEALVKSLGGTTKSSVVKGLSYLVTNTPGSGSSKNKKAHELLIPIISEEQFIAFTKTGIPSAAGEEVSSAAEKGAVQQEFDL